MIVLKFQAVLVKELFCDILLWFDVLMDFAKDSQRKKPFDVRQKNKTCLTPDIKSQNELFLFSPIKAAFNHAHVSTTTSEKINNIIIMFVSVFHFSKILNSIT